jgi:hypothetical protein
MVKYSKEPSNGSKSCKVRFFFLLSRAPARSDGERGLESAAAVLEWLQPDWQHQW